jgi:hypothetical protein
MVRVKSAAACATKPTGDWERGSNRWATRARGSLTVGRYDVRVGCASSLGGANGFVLV